MTIAVTLGTVPVQLRRDRETGRPVLFFRNENSYGWRWLECYDHIGQHSQAHEGYRLACAPLPVDDLPADALALLAEWNGQGVGEPVGVPVARLP